MGIVGNEKADGAAKSALYLLITRMKLYAPARDLSGGIIMDFNQNAENQCICHPEIHTNIFKFQTGVLCYNKEI